MKIQPLAGSTATALRKKLPAAASVGNPIDVLGDADPDRYVTAVEAAQQDDSIDAIVVILTPQAMTNPAETARAITACNTGRKPILASFMGGEDVMPGREELVAANLPDYPAPERAVAVVPTPSGQITQLAFKSALRTDLDATLKEILSRNDS